MASEDFLLGLLGAFKAGEKGLDVYRERRQFADELARKQRAEDREESRYGIERAEKQSNRLEDIGFKEREFGQKESQFARELASKEKIAGMKPGPDDLSEITRVYDILQEKKNKGQELTGQETLLLDAASQSIKERARGKRFPSQAPAPTLGMGKGRDDMKNRLKDEIARRSQMGLRDGPRNTPPKPQAPIKSRRFEIPPSGQFSDYKF